MQQFVCCRFNNLTFQSKNPKYISCNLYNGRTINSESCETISYTPPQTDNYPAYVFNVNFQMTIRFSKSTFRNFDVDCEDYPSLITISGSTRSAALNVESCIFNNNIMNNRNSEYNNFGLFYINGKHSIQFSNSIFSNNQGFLGSVIGGTCNDFSLTNCYIKSNTANSFYGQIYLRKCDLAENSKIYLFNVSFLNNQVGALAKVANCFYLTNFPIINMTQCTFSAKESYSQGLAVLKSTESSVVSFQDCCFYYSLVSSNMQFYHIRVEQNSKVSINFYKTNVFNGVQTKSINVDPIRTDNEIYNNEEQCGDGGILPSSSPTETYTTISSEPTTTSGTMTETKDAATITYDISITDDYITSDWTRYTEEPSPSDDSYNNDDKQIYKEIWFIIAVILAAIVAIAIICFIAYRVKRKSQPKGKTEHSLNLPILDS